jgi:hypothetical protein
MARITPKDFFVWVTLSFVVITFLNVVISRAIPEIPIIKSGFFLILILASVAIVMAFVFASDKQITTQEIVMYAIILITLFAVYYAIKTYVPELFSLIPEATKEPFEGVIGG